MTLLLAMLSGIAIAESNEMSLEKMTAIASHCQNKYHFEPVETMSIDVATEVLTIVDDDIMPVGEAGNGIDTDHPFFEGALPRTQTR